MVRTQTVDSRLRDPDIVARVRSACGDDNSLDLCVTESLVHFLRTYAVVHDSLNDCLAESGLSLAKLSLLYVLRNAADEGLAMSDIGQRMAVTCANITKLVDGLAAGGYVRRIQSPFDRRVVLASLTAEGFALLQRVQPEYMRNVRRFWSGLNEDECLELIHLMMKLRESFRSAPPADVRPRERNSSRKRLE